MKDFRYRGLRKVRGDSKTIQRRYKSHRIDKDQVEDNLYKCWFCGFNCNIDREQLGKRNSKNHISYSDFQTPSDPMDGDELSGLIVLGGVLNAFVGMELSADGITENVIRHDLYPSSKTGCPLCGTLNWLGKY